METIIFDIDDTLYDQLQPFKNAFELNFKHLTHVPIEKLYIASRKYSDALFDKSESGEISLTELHSYRIMAACKEFGIEITYNEAIDFQKTYELEQKKIMMFPEMITLLNQLHEMGKQLGVLTNGPYHHQLMKVERLGLTKWIPEENIFISESIGSAKPDPEAFLIVERNLKLHKKETVYIGDSFNNDIIGAKQVGWKAIWMNHRGRNIPNNTIIRPDKTVYKPAELLDLVGNYL